MIEAGDERRLLVLQKKLSRLKLLIIDELGFVPLSKTGAELLFEVFSQRYETGSVLVTTNLPFDEWTEVLGSERLTGALLDRLTHHVHTLLKIHGRAAVVVPDNVLFEGGAGETVRRRLLQECDVHTLLRLPTGVFYAQGVKANVLFFDRKPARETPWTEDLWIYDLRTNQRFTLKTNPLTRSHLDDFVACYNPDNRREREETERFRCFGYDDLIKRDKASLDIFWLRDESMEDSASLPPPALIAEEIVEDLRAALEQIEEIAADLSSGPALS